MGSDSSVALTAGAGTAIDTFQLTGGDHQQVIRQARCTSVSLNSWTAATAGQASQIAADVNRVVMLIVSAATGRIWLRWDSTIPTSTTYQWYLDPGDRFEVPAELSTQAVSMGAATAGGLVLSTLAIAS